MANQYTGRTTLTILQRLVAGCSIDGDCLVWRNDSTADGYGSIGIYSAKAKKYLNKLAHRIAYETYFGKIPRGLVIDHLCGVRNCIKPEHLEAVTQKENVMRATTSLTTINSKKTHCKNGHEFTQQNTYVPPKRQNRRYCRACHNRRVRIGS